MPILRVIKRDISAANNDVDFNPSVFKYYVDRIEVKKQSVKDGLKSAFCGMLDEMLRPDETDFNTSANWSFGNRRVSAAIIGGTTTTINTYTGVKYIYRQATQTLINAAVPANLNGFEGLTYKSSLNPMTFTTIYTLTTDLNEITHGELIQDGQANTIVPIQNLGGTPRILASFNTVNAGYYAVQPGEQGTHGVDEFNDYRPLSYWNETYETGPTVNNNEYYGLLTENTTGFTLDSEKILLSLTDQGDALARYNPSDLAVFVSLISIQFNYRPGKPAELEL